MDWGEVHIFLNGFMFGLAAAFLILYLSIER